MSFSQIFLDAFPQPQKTTDAVPHYKTGETTSAFFRADTQMIDSRPLVMGAI